MVGGEGGGGTKGLIWVIIGLVAIAMTVYGFTAPFEPIYLKLTNRKLKKNENI